ncbi:protein immune deficiency isoform X2 [Anthonomus grandis grandis]|nr:protein immune deficiency isoform X2 [Anthonomus grandis grandis]
MSESFLTTDALPSSPRDEPNPTFHNGSATKQMPKESTDKGNSDEGFEPQSQSAPNSGFYHKKPQVVNNVIQVINSPGTRIGSTHHYHSSPKSRAHDSPTITETEKMALLKKSTEPVFQNDIDALKEHIGHNYRSIFNKLGLSLGEIQQAEMGYSKNESEMMRVLLLKWRQSNFKEDATVGRLARALWDCNEHEALRIWASQYDQLHQEVD